MDFRKDPKSEQQREVFFEPKITKKPLLLAFWFKNLAQNFWVKKRRTVAPFSATVLIDDRRAWWEPVMNHDHEPWWSMIMISLDYHWFSSWLTIVDSIARVDDRRSAVGSGQNVICCRQSRFCRKREQKCSRSSTVLSRSEQEKSA